MKKLIVKPDFWELFADAKIGLVVLKGINNKQNPDVDFQKMLYDASKIAEDDLESSVLSENKVVKVWREAYQKFKTKKGARCSVEALLKRAMNGSPVGLINPLVDIYNTASLTFALPCGGEDLDKVEGDVLFTKAKADGTESFITLGSEESSSPYEGELVYKDSAGVLCRCLNWRESVRTMLTEDTTNAMLIVETIDITRDDAFFATLQSLSENATKYLGGTASISVVDHDHPETIICE